MQVRRISPARWGLFLLTFIWLCVLVPISAAAAPYAGYVIDARTGQVLYSRNADTRLHPASLTKMMTLYIAFEAIRNGEITLDTKVRVSKRAAAEPPSKLGLKAGQRIALRYLIRAAAVKSANDAATAIGEAISGSESAFARRMNRTAKSMGMTRTTFKNAHGLTEKGHLSTARDMTALGRHLIYDYPQYYNLFSRKTANAGVRNVSHTNRRLLSSYRGADGIKTGYTRAAGFNLVASARRGNERIIATVFGGKSTASRNAKVAELLDLGFRKAPSRASLRKPARPSYTGNTVMAENTSRSGVAAGKTIRVAGTVQKSLRPKARAARAAPVQVAAVATPPKPQDDALQASIAAAVATSIAPENDKMQASIAAAVAAAATAVAPPPPALAAARPAVPSVRPAARPEKLVLASVPATAVAEPTGAAAPAPPQSAEPEIVTRLSTSGGQHWGINVGRYGSRYQAEKVLLRTALTEITTLEGSLRKVTQSPRGFDANFVGMTRETADLACRRLKARNVTCFMIGPS
ncbi:D-alanyl-D-alanine carboxypeptidase family protein [Sedimentitalea sp. HM32M-2]|uniref:D-alanyl-D-alanine carboxypeptidase family protein n=1 Tax=Sedimentitalea sp. HM32M-2 TaxID=3351566 RepID=UPI00362A11C5